MAASVDPATRNLQFQPGAAKSFKVVRPAQSRVLGGEQRYPVKVQKITPVLSLPNRVQIGRSVVRTPADAAVRPAVAKAGGAS
jgi:hypothetical protein